MFPYVWPIALVVLSNVLYQICAKSIPANINPFASLTVTYLVGAAVSAVLYYSLNHGGSLIREYRNINLSPFLFGVIIVGLETGWIYAYKAGWKVSTASLTQSTILAIALLFVGFLLFREALTWNKLVGMAVCLLGLFFINL